MPRVFGRFSWILRRFDEFETFSGGSKSFRFSWIRRGFDRFEGFSGCSRGFSRFSWIHRGFDGFEATLSKFSGFFFSGGSKGFGRFSWILKGFAGFLCRFLEFFFQEFEGILGDFHGFLGDSLVYSKEKGKQSWKESSGVRKGFEGFSAILCDPSTVFNGSSTL